MMRDRRRAGLVVAALTIFLPIVTVAGTVELPRTGQTTSHYAVDDGWVEAGIEWPVPRFTDNGDGTVTDRLTGLMWLGDASCFEAQDWESALATVTDFNAVPLNYDCIDYDESDPPYSDWRLANVNELESLVHVEVTDTAAWLTGQGMLSVEAEYYWASTTVTGTLRNRWAVHMRTGNVSGKSMSGSYGVWPVRAGPQGVVDPTYPANVWKTGQTASWVAGDDGATEAGVAWPVPRFTDHGDGTVTDELTGLMWLGDAGCITGKWAPSLDAIADFNVNPGNYACTGYSTANPPYDDWRLSNKKELHSLTDFGRRDVALPAGHPFVNVASGSTYYYSSTTFLEETDKAWVVRMLEGPVNDWGKVYFAIGPVWPVRAGRVPVASTTTSTTTTTIPAVVCGDATGDGQVKTTDALVGLKTAVGGGTCPPQRCDVNNSGKITTTDALLILKVGVGKQFDLVCPA